MASGVACSHRVGRKTAIASGQVRTADDGWVTALAAKADPVPEDRLTRRPFSPPGKGPFTQETRARPGPAKRPLCGGSGVGNLGVNGTGAFLLLTASRE